MDSSGVFQGQDVASFRFYYSSRKALPRGDVFSFRKTKSGKPFRYEHKSRLIGCCTFLGKFYMVGPKSLRILSTSKPQTVPLDYIRGEVTLFFSESLMGPNPVHFMLYVDKKRRIYLTENGNFYARSKASTPREIVGVSFGYYRGLPRLFIRCDDGEILRVRKRKKYLAWSVYKPAPGFVDVFSYPSGNIYFLHRAGSSSTIGFTRLETEAELQITIDTPGAWRVAKVATSPDHNDFSCLVLGDGRWQIWSTLEVSDGPSAEFLHRPLDVQEPPLRMFRTKFHVVLQYESRVEAHNIVTRVLAFTASHKKINYVDLWCSGGAGVLVYAWNAQFARIVDIQREDRDLAEYCLLEGRPGFTLRLIERWKKLGTFSEYRDSYEGQKVLERLAWTLLDSPRPDESTAAVKLVSRLPIPVERVVLKIWSKGPKVILQYLHAIKEYIKEITAPLPPPLWNAQLRVIDAIVINFICKTSDETTVGQVPIDIHSGENHVLDELIVRNRLGLHKKTVFSYLKSNLFRDKILHYAYAGQSVMAIRVILQSNSMDFLSEYGFSLYRHDPVGMLKVWRGFLPQMPKYFWYRALKFVLALRPSPEERIAILDFLEDLIKRQGGTEDDPLLVYFAVATRLPKSAFRSRLARFRRALRGPAVDRCFPILIGISTQNACPTASVALLIAMKRYPEAVKLGIEIDSPKLVQEAILECGDETLRQHLWRKVREHVLRKIESGMFNNNVEMDVDELTSFDSLNSAKLVKFFTGDTHERGMDIREILVKMPQIWSQKGIKVIEGPMVKHLRRREQVIGRIKSEVKELEKNAEIYERAYSSQRRTMVLAPGPKMCSRCGLTLMADEPFCFFPCGHIFHKSCYLEFIRQIADGDAPTRAYGCISCGNIAIESIRKPYPDLFQKEEEKWDLKL